MIKYSIITQAQERVQYCLVAPVIKVFFPKRYIGTEFLVVTESTLCNTVNQQLRYIQRIAATVYMDNHSQLY